MSRTQIGVGAVANDGTGDPLRTAYIKLNKLFSNPASSDPTAANDTTQGYDVGSTWYNSATSIFWECRDASTGAAVWARQSVYRRRNFRSGCYYMSLSGVTLAAGAAAANSNLCLIPFEIEEAITISELGAMVTTLFSGGKFMLGVYATNYATGRATGNPVAQVVDLSTTAATVVSKALAANVTLQPGIYWMGSQTDNATAALQSLNQANVHAAAWIGSTLLSRMTGAATASILEHRVTNTYGTFPDLTSATFTESNVSYMSAVINFKVA